MDTSNLLPIRITDDLPSGIQAKNTVRYDNAGKLISVDSAARHGLLAAAKKGNKRAQAIIREEAQSHAREKPLDPLKTKSGHPMPQEAYIAIRAQRELAMRVKGEALQAHAEASNVSPAKQALKEPLQEMTRLIREGNHAEALKIADEYGINDTYLQQYKKDYEHNVNPNRRHLEQTSFGNGSDEAKLNQKIDTSIAEKLIEDQLEKIEDTIESIKDAKGILEDVDPKIRDTLSEALSTKEQKIITDELSTVIKLIENNPRILKDPSQKHQIEALLESAKSAQDQVKDHQQKLAEMTSEAVLRPKNESELEALKLRVENINTHEQLSLEVAAKRLQLQELIRIQEEITAEGSKPKTDTNKKKNLEKLSQKRKEILNRKIERPENSEIFKKALAAVKTELNEKGAWKQMQKELDAVDPKIKDAAYELMDPATKTKPMPTQVRAAHQIAQYLNSIKAMANFDQYLSNIKELQKHFPNSLLKSDMEQFKQFKIEDNNPGSLNQKMQGVFAERNVLLKDIELGRNSSPLNGTGIISDRIIDSNGQTLATSYDLIHPDGTKHGLSLRQISPTSYEVLDNKGEPITVRNGSNQESKLIMSDNGTLTARKKAATIVYDAQSGRYIAREIDLVTHGKLGDDAQDQRYLQEIKNAASTMRNKYNSDDGRQFRALLALSQQQNATAVIRINQPESILTNSRSADGFSREDYKTYNEMLNIAAARNQRLIFADENGNILNDNIRANNR